MFRSGLHKNRSLIYMPTPSSDINEAIQGAKDKNPFSIPDVIKEIDEVSWETCFGVILRRLSSRTVLRREERLRSITRMM